MIQDRIGFGELVALAFARDDMQKLWSAKLLQIEQSRDQRIKVMSVDRSDVVKAQFFEQGPRCNHALDVFLNPIGKIQHAGHGRQHLLTRAAGGIKGTPR